VTGSNVTFRVRINDDAETDLTVATGIYASAASAVPAIMGIEQYPVDVQIWVAELQLDYPPLRYCILEAGGAAQLVIRKNP
jgi:hypothetical protein